MRGRALGGALLSVLALSAMPAAALGDPLHTPAGVPQQFQALLRERIRTTTKPRAAESRFALKAKHGYQIAVIATGDVVALAVARGRSPLSVGSSSADGFRPGAITAYLARGAVTPGRIAASFGPLGRVAVRFHPSGRIGRSPSRRHCRGADHFTSRLGVFTGTIRFKGENSYVSVRAHRAKGRIRTPLQLHCSRFRFGPRPRRLPRSVRQTEGLPFAFFSATQRQGVSATEVFVLQIANRTLVEAVTEQSFGTWAEVRFAIASARKKRLLVLDDALTKGTLNPPWPFMGIGIYGAAPDGTTSWSGSLTAAFPGASRLPLTGPGFKATLDSSF